MIKLKEYILKIEEDPIKKAFLDKARADFQSFKESIESSARFPVPKFKTLEECEKWLDNL